MSIALSENLKREWTDKYVVVQEGVPELRRFVGLTGQVRTVNMNCRALVQFDHPVDISWYDIDPAYLKIVPAPAPKPVAAPTAAKAVAAPAPKPAAPAAEGAKKLSPLELARMQGAAGGAKKLSPLELARQQGAAKATPATETPPPAGEAKKLSPLELARQQGAAKAKPTTETPPPATEPVVEQPAEAAPPAPQPAPVEKPAVEAKPAADKPLSVAEMIALARKQGAQKKD